MPHFLPLNVTSFTEPGTNWFQSKLSRLANSSMGYTAPAASNLARPLLKSAWMMSGTSPASAAAANAVAIPSLAT
jgi:hypothetical protein